MHIPTIKYESESQFRMAMDNNAYDIHMRTLYGIKEALRIKEDYVTIAYLETDNHHAELGAPIDIWPDNLEKSLEYFEEIEEYKRCQEVVDLIKILEEQTIQSIFIDMDANRRRVDKLLSDKWKIDREIEQIQANCKHENTVIKQVADGTSSSPRHVCESCGCPLGYLSPQDAVTFLKKS